jgi:transcriptional regulator with XRE-family HTH domain
VKRANAIDIHVGARIRMRRAILGMSQEKLGDALGVTFQQVQKYEKGTNRVGASRLQAIADTLKVAPAFFFEEAPGAGTAPEITGEASDIQQFLATSEGIQLVRAFTAIKDAATRHKFLGLIKAVAHLSEGV